jgi:hypothetical protein
MVAVAILAIIVVTFSVILSQSQRVVSTGQQSMRANATAAAIEQAVRKDLRRLTHNGFLMVHGPEDRMQLWLVTAGPSRSITGGPDGTGAIIGYGLCDNPNAAEPDADVLWRTAYVLHRDRTDSVDWTPVGGDTPDVVQADLADLQRMTASDIESLVSNVVLDDYVPDERRVPPRTLTQIEELWAVLREDVETFQVAWTDRAEDADGNIEWYTPDNPKGGGAGFESGSGSSYQALWTRHNLDDWPIKIRIRFTLSRTLFPPDVAPPEYEIVYPVPRAERGWIREP